jgi:hypothetical protein
MYVATSSVILRKASFAQEQLFSQEIVANETENRISLEIQNETLLLE